MVFWSHSLQDLQTITRLKVQYDLIKVLCVTESLQLVASAVFGGKDSKQRTSGKVREITSAADLDLSRWQ